MGGGVFCKTSIQVRHRLPKYEISNQHKWRPKSVTNGACALHSVHDDSRASVLTEHSLSQYYACSLTIKRRGVRNEIHHPFITIIMKYKSQTGDRRMRDISIEVNRHRECYDGLKSNACL